MMFPNDADSMANSVDPDQTAPQEQSDLGLHCLPRPVCPKPRIITVDTDTTDSLDIPRDVEFSNFVSSLFQKSPLFRLLDPQFQNIWVNRGRVVKVANL